MFNVTSHKCSTARGQVGHWAQMWVHWKCLHQTFTASELENVLAVCSSWWLIRAFFSTLKDLDKWTMSNEWSESCTCCKCILLYLLWKHYWCKGTILARFLVSLIRTGDNEGKHPICELCVCHCKWHEGWSTGATFALSFSCCWTHQYFAWVADPGWRFPDKWRVCVCHSESACRFKGFSTYSPDTFTRDRSKTSAITPVHHTGGKKGKHWSTEVSLFLFSVLSVQLLLALKCRTATSQHYCENNLFHCRC